VRKETEAHQLLLSRNSNIINLNNSYDPLCVEHFETKKCELGVICDFVATSAVMTLPKVMRQMSGE
jgi:hypothetical protein